MNNYSLNQTKLTNEQIKIFNTINFNNKKKFDELLKKIFLQTKEKNKKWMISPLFSRDSLQSKLFLDLNFLKLIDYYVKRKNLKIVYVENFFLKKIILNKYKNLNVFCNKNILINFIVAFFQILNSALKIILFSGFMLLAKKKNRKKKFKNKKIILIETFFSKNLIINDQFKERYHKGLFKKLSKAQRKDCFFFPINLSIFYIFKFLRITKNEKINYLHLLDYLKIQDYFKSIFILPSLGKIDCKKIVFDQYKIGIIINYYKFVSYFNESSFLANLNFHFLKRLKEEKIDIKLIIDWYENQIIDKGLILGKNTFYPKTKIKGHVGFVNDFKNIHHYTPTKLEKKLKVLPDEVLIISKALYFYLSKKIKFLNFKIVPAIRNERIFNIKKIYTQSFYKKNKNLLFVLSSNQEEADFIFNLIQENLDWLRLNNYKITLKTHSNIKLNSFINNNKKILIYKKDFYKILTKAEIVISGGTTATVDSYILNKKIILICSSNGLIFNPLINFSKKKVKICYDRHSFIKNLKLLTNLKNKNDNIINLKELKKYFEKFEPKKFENFIN